MLKFGIIIKVVYLHYNNDVSLAMLSTLIKSRHTTIHIYLLDFTSLQKYSLLTATGKST